MNNQYFISASIVMLLMASFLTFRGCAARSMASEIALSNARYTEQIHLGRQKILAWQDTSLSSRILAMDAQSDALTTLGVALRSAGADDRIFTSSSPLQDGGMIRTPITAHFTASPQSVRTAVMILRDGSHAVRVTRLMLKRKKDAAGHGLCDVDLDFVSLTSARAQGDRHEFTK